MLNYLNKVEFVTQTCLFVVTWLVFGKLLQSVESRRIRNDQYYRYYNVGVLMASKLDSPFDIERCGPAIDLALQEVNEKFLAQHKIKLQKVQAR